MKSYVYVDENYIKSTRLGSIIIVEGIGLFLEDILKYFLIRFLALGLFVFSITAAQAAPVDTNYISVTVDRPLAQIGDTLIYQVSFSNPSGFVMHDVVIRNEFDARLTQVQAVSATIGEASRDANTISLTGFSLEPNESGAVVISATLAERVEPGEVVPAFSVLEAADFPSFTSNTATVTALPGSLPATGESPFGLWREPILALLILSVATTIGMGLQLRARRRLS